ncbi:MAG: hypothetical protein LUG51_00160 [Tannerellaceae bacterium]|nr:hypothetical protein [Tannerellaceae bacterium]
MEVVELAFEKEFIRQEYYGVVSATSQISWFLIGRTMQSAGYTPFIKEVEKKENLRYFLESFYIDKRPSQKEQTELMFLSIYEYGLQYIKQYI